MARRRQPVTAPQTSLPEGVKDTDKAYPKKGMKTALEFLQSGRFGWCVKTLPINQRSGRTYGMSYDGTIVTMGGRPDDYEKTVRVYVTEANEKRLAKWLELKEKGMNRAGDIRDRIGSRRAEGQEKRAAGYSSWMWSK